METKSKRIYPSTQLIVALDSKILKVYLWILSWASSTGSVKYYSKQFAKACKLEEDEVERCIQSLIDCKLVDVSKIDQTWMLTPNEEQNQKYYKLPISKVLEGKGIEIASVATWNEEAEVVPTSNKMSRDEIKRTILMLQAQLKEADEVAKMVETNDVTDLPF